MTEAEAIKRVERADEILREQGKKAAVKFLVEAGMTESAATEMVWILGHPDPGQLAGRI